LNKVRIIKLPRKEKKMKKLVLLVLFLLFMNFTIGSNSLSAALFVSGDANISNALVGVDTSINSGNQQFFTNILQGGTNVVVLKNNIGSGDDTSTFINTFYSGLSGVTSTLYNGAVNDTLLSGKNLFVASMPDDAFTSAEISSLNKFLASGGSIFLLGEWDGFLSTRTGYINTALAELGSSMSIILDYIDSEYHTATGSQIAADPFTLGVTSFSYAATSQVGGGTPLFFGTEGQPFVEYTATNVPEPATMLLLGFGIVGLAGLKRKKR
jgi:hypothetical protein